MVRSGLTSIVRWPGLPKAAVAAFLGLVIVLGSGLPAACDDAPMAAISKAHVKDGIAALDHRDSDRAVLEFERAITADPHNARAFAWLGYVHGRAGEPKVARKYYRLALEINPDDVKALLWNGQLDVAGQDLAAARVKLAHLGRVCARDCEEYRTLEHSIRTLTARLEQH